MLEAILVVSVSVLAAAAPPQDPDEALRSRARRAAGRYERLLRRRAPTAPSSGASGDCHEVIGRFCFHFDDAEPPPDTAPDPAEIREARTVAVRAHRAWFSRAPADSAAAGALVRYLIDAERESEAVAAARTHAWAADRRPASLLTLGLALHEAGRVPEAEAVFDELRGKLPVEERERLDDVSMLLDSGERRVYRRLEPGAREAYHRRFWALADPSLLEPGNERRSAHYARHAWAAILSRAPPARGRPHWGRDSEEVALRYGLPTGRERVLGPIWRPSSDFSMIEHYDSRAVPLVPRAAATEGVPPLPEPGAPSPLEATRVRSAYVPRSLPHFHPLTVQVGRIPVSRGVVLMVSGRLARDTTAPPPRAPRGLLAVLDTAGRIAARSPGRVRVEPDGAIIVDAEVPVPPGEWLYQLEVRDDSTGTGGRVQAPIAVPSPERLALSDLLVAAPDSTVRARSDLTRSPGLVLRPGAAVLLWAEVRGLERRAGEARYQLEWWVEAAEPGSWLGKAARWLGRRLGVAGESAPIRVRWQADERGEAAPVFLHVALDLDPGRYRVGLRLRDRISGRAAVSTRLVLLDPQAPALRPRSRD